jgi:hypothetical protein
MMLAQVFLAGSTVIVIVIVIAMAIADRAKHSWQLARRTTVRFKEDPDRRCSLVQEGLRGKRDALGVDQHPSV